MTTIAMTREDKIGTGRLSLSENSAGQGLLLTTLALLALGVIMVHAAMVRPVTRDIAWYSRIDVRHTMYAAIAALVLFTVWRLDYHRLDGRKFPYGAGLLLLISLGAAAVVLIPGVGHREGDYARWLRIGPRSFGFGFQPSELVKFALVIFLAAWLGRESCDVRSFFRTFVPAVGVIGISVGAVITEDFSTGAVTAVAAVVTLLLARVPWYYLLVFMPPAVVGSYFEVYCKEYRWKRVMAWLDPWNPNNSCTYQARESLIAICTGGWTGKGLGQGSVKLGHLPEASTDFIFSVYCEELGYIGAILLMGLVLLWMWHARKAAVRASDRFGMVLAGSLGFLIAMQSVMHIAVALVTAPTTGAGLPFVSAGGTSLIISAAAVALIVSVTARGKSRADLVNYTFDKKATSD